MPRSALIDAGYVHKLTLPVPTRFGSYYTMFNHISESKVSLQAAVFATKVSEVTGVKDVQRVLTTEDFWNNLEQLINITRPLAKAILCIEGDIVEKSSALYAVEQGFSGCLLEIQNFDMKSEAKSELKSELTEVNLS